MRSSKSSVTKKKDEFLFCEMVAIGHPDRICDLIADALLDECLKKDPTTLAAFEVIFSGHTVVIGGEVSTTAQIDPIFVVKRTLLLIGYSLKWGLDISKLKVIYRVQSQSINIKDVVQNKPFHIAGDQSIVYGYATNETQSYMPLEFEICRGLINELREYRKLNSWIGPDAKCLINFNVAEKSIEWLFFNIQHHNDYRLSELRKEVENCVIKKVLDKYKIKGSKKAESSVFFLNKYGKFVLGGSLADTGLTGRKLLCDSYGSNVRHGGGSFSGKDGSKVDRLGAYLARYIAKNVVASGLADKCEVQLVYSFGGESPLSVSCKTFKTSVISEKVIESVITKEFSLSINRVFQKFKLDQPKFFTTSWYGHFGNEWLPWEQLDIAETIKNSSFILTAEKKKRGCSVL